VGNSAGFASAMDILCVTTTIATSAFSVPWHPTLDQSPSGNQTMEMTFAKFHLDPRELFLGTAESANTHSRRLCIMSLEMHQQKQLGARFVTEGQFAILLDAHHVTANPLWHIHLVGTSFVVRKVKVHVNC
tara:strand:+ start:256 stop:648 length:393 start_codon:yes stop_codon:yes gene_type:complete